MSKQFNKCQSHRHVIAKYVHSVSPHTFILSHCYIHLERTANSTG